MTSRELTPKFENNGPSLDLDLVIYVSRKWRCFGVLFSSIIIEHCASSVANTLFANNIIHNDPGGCPFSVNIDKTSTVEFVKGTITRIYPHTFQGIDVKNIVLWKVHLHIDETARWKTFDPTITTTTTILHESDSVTKCPTISSSGML
ncbi:hypothetical protein BC938DRAFT_482663 [Jimgerdemannia flammicorona]|uniref:Crinkler effector protein N-terminal domain-containing protein n=1 Tax=Jimgerdemannia flammicorona TaxID=994334 RepID=A0A433QDK7_9FUNG|nr:hypothetical protein BC938DRAFT_482663 [Jimgerdemannia flammicorona]